jgi:hypothetical protein
MNSSDLTKAGRLLGNLAKLPFTNPRGLRAVLGVAGATAESVVDPEADVIPIPVVSIEQLINEHGTPIPLQVHGFPQIAHSISLIEAVGLAVLMKKANAKRVFEFGTHRGVSTSQLASNLPESGEVLTLDLPRSDRRTHYSIDNPGDIEVSQMPEKADLIPENLRSRIRFLEHDSATFDESPYVNQMDFVFVDGAHTAEYVRSDSEKAWKMVRPGGIVAWHDCRPQTPDVVHYLRVSSYQPRRLSGCTIAFAIKPKA